MHIQIQEGAEYELIRTAAREKGKRFPRIKVCGADLCNIFKIAERDAYNNLELYFASKLDYQDHGRSNVTSYAVGIVERGIWFHNLANEERRRIDSYGLTLIKKMSYDDILEFRNIQAERQRQGEKSREAEWRVERYEAFCKEHGLGEPLEKKLLIRYQEIAEIESQKSKDVDKKLIKLIPQLDEVARVIQATRDERRHRIKDFKTFCEKHKEELRDKSKTVNPPPASGGKGVEK